MSLRGTKQSVRLMKISFKAVCVNKLINVAQKRVYKPLPVSEQIASHAKRRGRNDKSQSPISEQIASLRSQ